MDLIRDHGPEVGRRRLDAVTPYLGRGVVGIGLGGSEQLFPAAPYEEVYRDARRRGFRLTAHAGEVAGAGSVRDAVERLGAERIGHGLRAFEDPTLVAELRERRIPLELCPVSNMCTGVWPTLRDHPVRRYFDAGLLVTVNSDDPTMFSTSITHEYEVLATELGFRTAELQEISLAGVEASFLDDARKAELRRRFEAEWADLAERCCL